MWCGKARSLVLAAGMVVLGALCAPAALAASAGDLDTSFSGDGRVTHDVFGDVDDHAHAVALQADGKIVVAGSFEGFGNNTETFAVARFNADGSLDTSFGSGGRVLTPFPNGPAIATGVAIQGGKIVAAGYRNDDDGSDDDDFAVARYDDDGELDTSFSGDGIQTVSFGGEDRGEAIAIQSDGRIVVAGTYRDSDDRDFAVARFNSSGSLDTSFDGDGKRSTGFGTDWDLANAVAIQSDGRIVVAGWKNDGDPNDGNFAVARYNSNGSLDTTFDGDGKLSTAFGADDRASAVAIQADGKVVAVGWTRDVIAEYAVARYNSNGSLDTTFGGDDGKVVTNVGGNGFAPAVAIQPDGKIVAAGAGPRSFTLVRYHPSGARDSGFGDDGRVHTEFISSANDMAEGIALQPDGKIIAAGSIGRTGLVDFDFALARYHGVTDSTPPGTVIDSGPTGPTSDTTPTFTFHSTEQFSTFECAIDSGSFASCRSPHTTAALANGHHTFWVRATDPSGNTDPTPAARGFSVDTLPPGTIIDSGPSGPTNDTTPTFAFHSTEAGSTFQCAVDGGSFVSCTSPRTISSLAPGPHTFRVRAIDGLGHTDLTPAERSFSVDTVAPDTILDSGPSAATDDSTPTFSFHSTEAGSTFGCSLDGRPAFESCASPHTTAALPDGPHRLWVRATDAAGNSDPTPAERSFTIQSPPPEPPPEPEPPADPLPPGSDPLPPPGPVGPAPPVPLDPKLPDTRITRGPTGATSSRTVRFAFLSPGRDGASFRCKLDDRRWTACTSPRRYRRLTLGQHVFRVRAVVAGRVDPKPATRRFTVVRR